MRAGDRAFAVGEKLVYDLSWVGMNVGKGTLAVEDKEDFEGKEAYKLVSSAESNNVLSFFFPVNDRVESIVDADEIFTYFLDVKQRHGLRHVDKSVRYDQESLTATMVYKGKARQYPIVKKSKDSLSSLYYFRKFGDVVPGQSFFIDVHESKKNWKLEIEVLNREKITVPFGTFDTFKTRAKVRYEGILMDKGDVFVWISDDERKIPVLIRGKVSIGPFVASLSDATLPDLSGSP